MKKYLFLYLILTFLTTSAKSVILPLSTPETSPHYGSAFVGIPKNIYEENGKIQKVTYTLRDLELSIEKTDTSLIYQPVKYKDKYIAIDPVEIPLSGPENVLKKIHFVDLTSCGEEYPMIWWGTTIANYNDSRLNDFPVTAQQLVCFNALYDNTFLEVVKQPSDSTFIIITPELSQGFRNGIEYKRFYVANDTIPLKNNFIKINNINTRDSLITISVLSSLDDSRKVKSELIVNEIYKRYVANSNELLVIDFFGSWCTPCIKGIGELVENFQDFGPDIKFVTIDCEEHTDNKENAENLLKDLGVEWPIKFELLGDGYNEALGIMTFPSYYIVHNGHILLITNNTEELIAFLKLKKF